MKSKRAVLTQSEFGETRELSAVPQQFKSSMGQVGVTSGQLVEQRQLLRVSDPPTQAEVQSLLDAHEELADDLRNLSTLIHSLRAAVVGGGVVKGAGSRHSLRRSGTAARPLSTLGCTLPGGGRVRGEANG
jgi:hypothetical protein